MSSFEIDLQPTAFMTISVERVAETYQKVTKDLNITVEKVKEDSRKFLQNVYFDDGTGGGSRIEVDKMIRLKLANGSFSGTIPGMMKKVRLKLKTIVTLYSTYHNSMSKLLDKVLGNL